jgi:hypothetical protein
LLASGAVLVVGGPQLAGAVLSGDTLGALEVLAKLEIGVTLTLAAAGLIIFVWQRSLKQSERSIGMRLWQKLRPFPAADSDKAAE